jgi:hypothetical protein
MKKCRVFEGNSTTSHIVEIKEGCWMWMHSRKDMGITNVYSGLPWSDDAWRLSRSGGREIGSIMIATSNRRTISGSGPRVLARSDVEYF